MKKSVLLIFAALLVVAAVVFAAMAYTKRDYARMASAGSSKGDMQLLAAGDSAAAAGDTEQALINYMLLCGRADSTMSPDRVRACISAHVKAGDIYYDTGDYTGALDFYLKGLELSDKSKEKPFMAMLYKDIGNVYNMFGEREQAIRHYREGLRYSSADPCLSLRLYNNLVRTYVMVNDLKNARLYHKKAGGITCNDATGKFLIDFNYALLLSEEGRSAEAIEMFKNIVPYAREHRLEPRYEAAVYEALYGVYGSIGMPDSVLAYQERCLALASQAGMTRFFTETYRDMADVYERQGDTRMALQLRSRYLQMKDSLFDERQFDLLKNQQLTYETGKTQSELREQRERERRHNELIRWQWAVIIIVVLGAVAIAVLLVNVYRKKNKLDTSYRNLYEVNRSYVENYRRAMERERDLQKELEACQSRIGELETTSLPEPPATDSAAGETEASPTKYSSSRLDKTRHTELLNKITRVMEDEQSYCSADFSLISLAAMVDSNSRYVSQVINEAYGKNFSNYVNEFRVRLACERFADVKGYGAFTIHAVGESVGFKSHTTFLTVFKKITGMTPSVYARMAREQEAK